MKGTENKRFVFKFAKIQGTLENLRKKKLVDLVVK